MAELVKKKDKIKNQCNRTHLCTHTFRANQWIQNYFFEKITLIKHYPDYQEKRREDKNYQDPEWKWRCPYRPCRH